MVEKKDLKIKDLKKKELLPSKEVPVYDFNLSKDKKDLKDVVGLGRKML